MQIKIYSSEEYKWESKGSCAVRCTVAAFIRPFTGKYVLVLFSNSKVSDNSVDLEKRA